MKIREKYFKSTSCRDKRSIVRSLNTFSKKFKYITCEKKDIDLDIDPMTLCYSDEPKENDVVFSEVESNLELKNTELILETVDNLISINRKEDLKKQIKEAIELRDIDNLNSFFKNEEISIQQIEEIVGNEKFAHKIFNQIKNRIKFARTGIYTKNTAAARVKNRIKTNPTTFTEIELKEFDFVIDNLWLLEDSVIEDLEKKNQRYKEVSEIVNRENKNIYNNRETVDMTNNSSLFMPLDGDYDEDEVPNSRMPLEMLLRENYGMYNQEVYNDYYSYNYEYEEFKEEAEYIKSCIERYMITIYNYEHKQLEIIEKIKIKIEHDDAEGLKKFYEYLNEKDYEEKKIKKKTVLEHYSEFNLLNEYLIYDLDTYAKISKIEVYKDTFLTIYPYLKFVKYYDISLKDYKRFIRFEKEFYINHHMNSNEMDVEWVETIMEHEYYGYYDYISKEEQYFVLTDFNRNNERYADFKKK